jgi:hypothetical protein
MAGINDSAKLDIQCPQCKGKFSKTIRELKGLGVKCPHCGVNFDTSKFKKGMENVDRTLKELVSKMKIIIKI